MAVVQRAVEAVAARAPRVSTVIKADWRAGASDAMTQKVASVERYLSALARNRVPERPLGRVAVDREYHLLQRLRLVLPDGVDHQPRRLVEREAADAGTEGHQTQRATAELVGLPQRGAWRPAR